MAYGVVLGQSSSEASNVNYDNSATSDIITSDNVQGAIDQLFTSVSEGKELIASAVTDKGVQTPADATFNTIADNIGKIVTSPFLNTDFTKAVLTHFIEPTVPVSVANYDRFKIVSQPKIIVYISPYNTKYETATAYLKTNIANEKDINEITWSGNDGFGTYIPLEGNYMYETNILRFQAPPDWAQPFIVQQPPKVSLTSSGYVQLKFALQDVPNSGYESGYKYKVQGTKELVIQSTKPNFAIETQLSSKKEWKVSTPYNTVILQ